MAASGERARRRNWRVARIVIFLIATWLADMRNVGNALTAEAGKHFTMPYDGFSALRISKPESAETDKPPSTNVRKTRSARRHKEQSGKVDKPISANPKPLSYVAIYDEISIALYKNSDWVSVNKWAAVAAPFLISLLAARTKRPRFANPVAVLLMVPVALGALFVVIVPTCCTIREMISRFAFMSMLSSVKYILLGILGPLCLLSDALDVPGARKRRLLKILGYRGPN